jgi:nucleoside-diphosphate-sugar epimerase
MNGQRIVVTGATGFVGKRLCRALTDRGYQLRILARSDKEDAYFRSLSAEILHADVTDPDMPVGLMEGADGVIHMAAVVSRAGLADTEFYDVHVAATRRLLDAAAAAGVKKFVHVSTIGVLGHIVHPPADEETPYNVHDIYQITKAEGEKAALAAHDPNRLSVTVVRPAAVYGPGDRRLLKLFRTVARGTFRMIGDGKTLTHPVYVDDLVDGIIAAYESAISGGRVYILGGPRAVTLNEWVATIATAADRPSSGMTIPYAPVWLAAVICEAVCGVLRIEPPLFRRRVDFFVKNRAFSIDRARKELGYDPSVDIADGAEKTLAWYRTAGLL